MGSYLYKRTGRVLNIQGLGLVNQYVYLCKPYWGIWRTAMEDSDCYWDDRDRRIGKAYKRWAKAADKTFDRLQETGKLSSFVLWGETKEVPALPQNPQEWEDLKDFSKGIYGGWVYEEKHRHSLIVDDDYNAPRVGRLFKKGNRFVFIKSENLK